MMLSGKGPSDAVEWDFQISEGRRAGEKAKIPVPSQWEQHGFGNYDYGTVPAKDKHKEDGIYQRGFNVPDDWRGLRVRIVFEGSMTDTTVTVNGKPAGDTHQGGFYRFHHDITDKIVFGSENRLEVLVSKDSANPTVEQAERKADFWVFGGIYRPVWLEARPNQSIEWTAIDARADGSFVAKVHLEGNGGADRVVAKVMERDGKPMGSVMESRIEGGGEVVLNGRFPEIRPWSAEEPNLYQTEISLMKGDEVMHRTVERTGFRTLETRPGQGVFVNGRRITVKGVNRHCFRPKSGRSLDPQDSIDDVRLIKSMNMNSVRCSHYPPDKAFLDACDELGLYVENEICTWQKPVLDTPTARRVIGQMIRRDVNHPSILWWANGNEGGWNTEVDGDFAVWDIQKRPVLHPWEEFSGYQTKHYPTWQRLQQDLADRFLVMPTEYLHGLYDGGHGAGLEDYWNAITSRPNGVGGFLWVLADEGIARSDRNGEIDNWGSNAPDGIVGPNHEKEASYWTAKDIFCPVQIGLKQVPADFDGRIEVRNTYDFRDLSGVRFNWKLSGRAGNEDSDNGHVLKGNIPGPQVAAGASGHLAIPLPPDWRVHGMLELAADDAEGYPLWTWSWPVTAPVVRDVPVSGAVGLTEADGKLLVRSGEASFTFNATNGLLEKTEKGGGLFGLAKGPRLASGNADDEVAGGFRVNHRITESGACRIEAASEGAFKSFVWTILPGGVVDLEYIYQIDRPVRLHGITFDLAQKEILGFSWIGQGPERVWANRMRGTRFGAFKNEFRKVRPGIDYGHPICAGYYAGVRQAEIRTKSGILQVVCPQDGTFLRIGTQDEGEKIQTWWPSGDFSVLHAIPAIGNKFHKPGQVGPQSEPHPAPGLVKGRVRLKL